MSVFVMSKMQYKIRNVSPNRNVTYIQEGKTGNAKYYIHKRYTYYYCVYVYVFN